MPMLYASKPIDSVGSMYGPQAAPRYTSSPLTQANASTVTGAISNAAAASDTDGPVNQVTILPMLDGTLFGKPVTHWFVLAALIIGVYYLMHRTIPGLHERLSTPRVGVGSFFSITLQAILGIALFKTVLTKYRVPGLTELVASV